MRKPPAGPWSRLRTWARRVSRAVFSSSEESAPQPVDQLIMALNNAAGASPRATRTEALAIPAMVKGRNMICNIATLPLVETNRKTFEVLDSPFLAQIDPDIPNVVTLAQTVEDLLFEGISWWQITAFSNGDLFPFYARHLDVGTVSLNPPADGRSPAPLPSGQDPRGAVVYVDGKPVPGDEIIRFDSPNPAVLRYCGRSIRRAALLEAAASMYAKDPRPQDYLQPKEGADPLDDDEISDLLADWETFRAERATGYLPAALDYASVNAPTPAELQLVELQKQAGLELANMLGVDPEDLGISTTSRTYANNVDRRRDRINDALAPYMLAITQRLSMNDVTRRGRVVNFDLDDYLKSNPTERWATYKTAKDIGVLSADEIRAKEKIPGPAPTPEPAPAPPTPEPAPAEPGDDDLSEAQADAGRVALAGAHARAALQLDGQRTELRTVDVPLAAAFTVKRGERLIEGLALPYGTIGSKYGFKFRFLRGSIRWGNDVGRIKLLRDHDMGQPIGRATSLTNTADGLQVKFKIARGDEGTRALELAEDRVLDGLSVGVDFDIVEDTEMDPNDDTVMIVKRADLREVSLTAMPLFDDARLSKVAANRNGGTPVEPCSQCGQQHAAGVACPQTAPPTNTPPAQQPSGMVLSQDQLSALLTRPGAIQALVGAQQAAAAPATPRTDGGLTLSAEQVDSLIRAGQLGVLLGVPQLTPAPAAGPAQPTAEPRATVDPTRRTAAMSASVQEPIPYRFDREGNLTKGVQYDFSRDLVSGSKGDSEAMNRATKFIQAMAPYFADPKSAPWSFDVDKADAAALNPNRNRPDMYVDQKDFTYPIWDAISKGTLADSTPFVLPKFSSASGLVAGHTEGVEPTAGTFVATAQTITPSATSGKVEITREAWDQGGNPQLSGIIWRQMVRAWFEALEAAAVAMLDGLTPTGITLSTASADDVLVGELEAALAVLQFVRGGFRMRDFFLQVDLYKALVNATDADGRKLIPRIGPVNATGQVSDFFADLSIGGLRGRPAWALAASGTVAASSYLFDRNDVHGWASAPERLEFQYRVAYVDVAIWGYKATANTDLTGVREVIYDPA